MALNTAKSDSHFHQQNIISMWSLLFLVSLHFDNSDSASPSASLESLLFVPQFPPIGVSQEKKFATSSYSIPFRYMTAWKGQC